jgi:shikimate kinase
MTVVLIGPPAAGKSRVGRRLAVRLGLPYLDTDKEIVKANGPIPRIFEEHGEPYFRELERRAVTEALTKEAVVAFGGGAVLDPATQADLARFPVVLLTITETAAAKRLKKNEGTRPLSASIEDWRALVERRTPLYESLADYRADTSSRPIERIVEEIALWIEDEQRK